MGFPSPPVQVLVVSLEDGTGDEHDLRPGSPATLLRSLGHQVMVVGYDLTELRERGSSVDIVVVEAGAHLEIGKDAVLRLRDRNDLARAGILICVEVTRVGGLDVQMGADDFILMPLAIDELSARVRQLTWRDDAQAPPGGLRYGDIVLDSSSRQAFAAGQPLKLTPYEFQLLKFFIEHAGCVYRREELLSRIWGYQYVGRVRTVDTHVQKLRVKMGAAGELIQSVRGMGYKLRRLGAKT